MSRRLFCATLPVDGGVVDLDAGAARHARVLRLAAGDPVRLFDGRGGEADATVTTISADAMKCDVAAREDVGHGGRPTVSLILGVPKGGKLETVVRMTTELGVAAIHLAICERSVARPDPERAAARVERLERVAREAARQSRHARVPALVPAAPLADVARRPAVEQRRLVLWERADIGFVIPPGQGPMWVLVGPEGGLSAAEVEDLKGIGYQACGLGPAILRVETAAPIAVALCLDRLGAFAPSP